MTSKRKLYREDEKLFFLVTSLFFRTFVST